MTHPSIFDDDFAEASIEAISLAAVRTPPPLPPQPQGTDENLFPTPPPPRSVIRRALSSLSGRARSDVRVLSFASMGAISEPLGDVKYSSMGDWWRDVLALPHNAVRAEVGDLVAMVDVLKNGGIRVVRKMAMIAQWWTGFEGFLSAWFGFEEAVLLPWIYRGNDFLGRGNELREKMKGHMSYVMELGMEVSNVFLLFEGGGCGAEVLPLLIRCVNEFVDGLLAFVDMEERILPSLIREGHTQEEAFNVTRLMCRKVDIVLLTRWIASRKERGATRRMYMNAASWVAFYAKRKRVYSDHLVIVEAVCEGVGVR